MSVMIIEARDPTPCFDLRRVVFMEEQGFSEAEEFDDLDATARHLLALDGDMPVATARLMIDGDAGRIGRICVLKSHRGTGLGAALVQDGLARLHSMPGLTRAVLGAQVRAMGFYEKLGFTACGPEYDDGGVPHREMERPL